MTKALLFSPVLIPYFTATLCFVCHKMKRTQRVLVVSGALLHLAAAIALFVQVRGHGIIAHTAGDWSAPFGITLVADLLSAIMVLVSSIIFSATVVYALFSIGEEEEHFFYYPLMHTLILGISWAFLTGDLFNMYVSFEVMLISSFILLGLRGGRFQMEGSMKYFLVNLLSSIFFLTGLGILYGYAGTLNMADLSVKLATADPRVVTLISMIFFVAFGIKSALFPVFSWLPAAYHTPPAATSAIFAGLLTKVGVYALIRSYTLIFVAEVEFTHQIIVVIACLTMLTGVLGAYSQSDFRRILSFHIISQIGYMIWGLGMFTQLALAGSIFYLFHHIIVKSNLFFISGIVQNLHGSYKLDRLGYLFRNKLVLSMLFFIPAFSLAGFPPLSGFFAKFLLVKAGVDSGAYWAVIIALFVGLMTALSMTKIWGGAFLKLRNHPVEGHEPPGGAKGMMVSVAILATITVLIGIFSGPMFSLAYDAATQILDRSVYITAVLGGGA
ncbi:MAG: Na+/H+ antiporter subunit D [Verrucomicrobia bacterium]|nr:Na+/H+ antiporter subunit D [Verrucomicrobiota bacterium]